jgi:hypothetical protein
MGILGRTGSRSFGNPPSGDPDVGRAPARPVRKFVDIFHHLLHLGLASQYNILPYRARLLLGLYKSPKQ